MKTYTPEKIEAIVKQRNALARCAIFAVNNFKIPGGGLVIRQCGGEFSTESWLTWFRRELKECGVEWDDELLEYSRASKTNRKRMLKESATLQAKLDANRKSTAA